VAFQILRSDAVGPGRAHICMVCFESSAPSREGEGVIAWNESESVRVFVCVVRGRLVHAQCGAVEWIVTLGRDIVIAEHPLIGKK
jgi:hypothetical protein